MVTFSSVASHSWQGQSFLWGVSRATVSVETGRVFSHSAHFKLWKSTSSNSFPSHRSSGLVNVRGQALWDFCGVDTYSVAVALTALITELGRNLYILGACELSAATSPDRHSLGQGGEKKSILLEFTIHVPLPKNHVEVLTSIFLEHWFIWK